MTVNLNDWLGVHVWAWWLAALVLVATSALVVRRLVVLAAALGPAVAAAVAVPRPHWFWLQAGSAVLTSTFAVVLVLRREARPSR